MASYKNPTFQERQTLAQQARDKALTQLRAKPVLDEATIAAQTAARIAREDAAAELSRAKIAAREQAKADKRAKALEAAANPVVDAVPVVQTEADKKAARDARYAARKNRTSGR